MLADGRWYVLAPGQHHLLIMAPGVHQEPGKPRWEFPVFAATVWGPDDRGSEIIAQRLLPNFLEWHTFSNPWPVRLWATTITTDLGTDNSDGGFTGQVNAVTNVLEWISTQEEYYKNTKLQLFISKEDTNRTFYRLFHLKLVLW